MLFNKGQFIELAKNRCLNQYHNGVQCNHCQNHCPTRAIVLYENQVYLDKDLCIGCGLCLSDCPTQVFHSKQWDEPSIIEEVIQQGGENTEFFCGRHSAPYKDPAHGSQGAVQIPACLSMVSKGAWYELGLHTHIELHLDQCKECPMAKTLSRLEYNVSVADEWLEACGHTLEFSAIEQSEEKKKKRLRAVETGVKVTSRRDWILSLVGRNHRKMEVTESKDFDDKLDQKREGNLSPNWQKRLEEVYPQHSKEGSPAAYWPTIRINNRCINCGMCAEFCPAKTLQIVTKGRTCTHHFTSGLCLDCRICQLFCPMEAISRDREKVEKPFETEVIYNASLMNCQRCGKAMFVDSTHLCYWCNEETSIADSFKENCRKLFLKM